MLKQTLYHSVAIAFFTAIIVFSNSFESASSAALTGREQAKRLAVIVNDVLTSYIAIHNDVFKVSAQRLVPIPGYFEAINFKQHVENLDKLRATLGQIDQEITHWIGSDLQDPEVRAFLEALQSYSRALFKTIKEFENISLHLYKKTQDPSYYNLESYSKDMDKYQKSIEGYQILATNLNELYKRIHE